jgi:peptidoglycan/LPS O-acetylase OafA/YrhL
MTGTHRKASAGRLASLDVLRFGAAMAVVLYHYLYDYADTTTGTLATLSRAIVRHGYLGVPLFFVISGFVVAWSAQGRTASGFARARILRLYPEFWLSVLLSALVFTLAKPGFPERLGLSGVLLNLTMLPQFLGAEYVDGVYWTLFLEIKFYLILFLLIVVGQYRNLERWLFAWLAVLATGALVDIGPVARSATIFSYGSLFVAGAIFSIIFERGWTAPRAAALVLALGLSIQQALGQIDSFVATIHITPVTRVSTVVAIGAIFGAFALVASGRLSIASSRLTATAGALTYPLYLLHNTGEVLFLAPGSPLPHALGVGIALLFALALAYAVMRLAESFVRPPLQRALDAGLRLLGTPRQKATTPSS